MAVSVQEYRYVGFIRTVSFLKTVDMFGPGNITEMKLVRNQESHRDRKALPKDPTKAKYMFRSIVTREDYVVDWIRRKHGGSMFPAQKVRNIVTKHHIGDFKVERVLFTFRSPRVVAMLNEGIKERAAGRKTEPVLLKPDTLLFAVFVSRYRDDYKRLDYIKDINRVEIEKYLFKHSCLELVALWTERREKYGESERIDVNEDKLFVGAILRDALDWNGWPPQLRLAKVAGVEKPVDPVSRRVERLSGVKGYVLVGEDELNDK